MFGAALVVLLIVAAASAKHVSKVRRNHNLIDSCYGANHPADACTPVFQNYTVAIALDRARSTDAVKSALQAENALEDLCRATREFGGCVGNTLDRASEECRKEYASQLWSRDYVNKGLSFIEVVCEDDFIDGVRRNLDCFFDEELTTDLTECVYPNIAFNCSQLYNPETIDYTAVTECYDKKFRKNCVADSVVECAAHAVQDACDDEAGDLATQAGNAFFERFPICPDDDRHFRNLLKFFKK